MDDCLRVKKVNCKLKWECKRMIYGTFEGTSIHGLFIKLHLEKYICVFYHDKKSKSNTITQHCLKGHNNWLELRDWMDHCMVPLRVFASDPCKYFKQLKVNARETSNTAGIRQLLCQFLSIYDAFLSCLNKIERIRYAPLEPVVFMINSVCFVYILFIFFLYFFYIFFFLYFIYDVAKPWINTEKLYEYLAEIRKVAVYTRLKITRNFNNECDGEITDFVLEHICSKKEAIDEKKDVMNDEKEVDEIGHKIVDKIDKIADKIDKIDEIEHKIDKIDEIAHKIDKIVEIADKIDKIDKIDDKLNKNKNKNKIKLRLFV